MAVHALLRSGRRSGPGPPGNWRIRPFSQLRHLPDLHGPPGRSAERVRATALTSAILLGLYYRVHPTSMGYARARAGVSSAPTPCTDPSFLLLSFLPLLPCHPSPSSSMASSLKEGRRSWPGRGPPSSWPSSVQSPHGLFPSRNTVAISGLHRAKRIDRLVPLRPPLVPSSFNLFGLGLPRGARSWRSEP